MTVKLTSDTISRERTLRVVAGNFELTYHQRTQDGAVPSQQLYIDRELFSAVNAQDLKTLAQGLMTLAAKLEE